VNSTGPMPFAIFDAATGGTQLWSQITTIVVQNGAFSVEITAPVTVFATGEPRWLEIGTGIDPFMPRVPIAATPYAFRANTAGDADTVDGKHASELGGGSSGWSSRAMPAPRPEPTSSAPPITSL